MDQQLQVLPFLKLTQHLKVEGWNISFLLGWLIFRCELLVSGSVESRNYMVFLLALERHHLFSTPIEGRVQYFTTLCRTGCIPLSHPFATGFFTIPTSHLACFPLFLFFCSFPSVLFLLFLSFCSFSSSPFLLLSFCSFPSVPFLLFLFFCSFPSVPFLLFLFFCSSTWPSHIHSSCIDTRRLSRAGTSTIEEPLCTFREAIDLFSAERSISLDLIPFLLFLFFCSFPSVPFLLFFSTLVICNVSIPNKIKSTSPM